MKYYVSAKTDRGFVGYILSVERQLNSVEGIKAVMEHLEREGHHNWLDDMGYSTDTDKAEDIEDVIKDFVCIEHEAPKLFNLLKNLSD